MPTILSLARRYKAGQMTREELLNILLGQFNYRVPSNHGLGYSDLPDQGAWRQVIAAHRAGYLSDDDYTELARRIFGVAATS